MSWYSLSPASQGSPSDLHENPDSFPHSQGPVGSDLPDLGPSPLPPQPCRPHWAPCSEASPGCPCPWRLPPSPGPPSPGSAHPSPLTAQPQQLSPLSTSLPPRLSKRTALLRSVSDPTAAPLTSGARSFSARGHPAHCKVLSSLLGLHPPDTRSTSPPASGDNQKCLQPLPSVPWGVAASLPGLGAAALTHCTFPFPSTVAVGNASLLVG